MPLWLSAGWWQCQPLALVVDQRMVCAERVRVSSSGAGGARAALVWVRARRVCGGVLVRARWAAAPAHCVAARNHPDLADSLPAWKISYQLQSDLYFGEPTQPQQQKSFPDFILQ